ncbi:MAG: sigma-70 family RNA polymerase sigma factor [Verrucomicrobiota bacterium]
MSSYKQDKVVEEPEEGPSDQELVARCQKGDRLAYDALVVRYRNRIFAMILNMVRNEADAWDLAQDAFVKAWLALPKFEARSSFYTWLYRIAHNVTYDWLRKKKIEARGEFNDDIKAAIEPGARTAPKGVLQPDEQARQQDIRRRLETALAELSPEHRSVVVMKEIEGRQYKEIAEIMECSIGTVMSRLFYARKKLQSLLQDVYETI